ncbi:MAG: DUF2138 family protein [Sulfuricella sp.]|nr:DUF2138 family protein [Sulfuricella sp.]
MRRTWIVVICLVVTAAAAAAYQRGSHWKEFRYTGTRLMADLARPDAVIRTASLSQLPRDLLKVPLARDVLTEDLAFYYEQHEDRLGLNGAIKRIAYEHKLDWSDRILLSVFNEPAEVALWRDGKGALRHYALVIRRNLLTKVLQQAANVALNDRQLKRAGEIDSAGGKATLFALEINPRRTLLLVGQGERLVVLSDPGLLFDGKAAMVPAARAAVVEWLENEGTLARQFALDGAKAESGATPPQPATHTFAVGAPTLALGYGAFMPGFRGIRFDFGGNWSTSLRIDPQGLPPAGLGDATLWRAAPANPSACAVVPVDWRMVQQVVGLADKKPSLPNATALAALDGNALACWYGEASLYAPVFVARLSKPLAQRNVALQALATWAISSGGALDKAAGKGDAMLWRGTGGAALGARGTYVAFSPDAALVAKVLDTIARSHPSVADQMPASNTTLALLTPRPLAAMAEKEMLAALNNAGDTNLLAAAQTHLPARMKALAAYPAYRLELTGKIQSDWQRVEWMTTEKAQ